MGNAVAKYERKVNRTVSRVSSIKNKLLVLINRSNNEEREIGTILNELSKTILGLQTVHDKIQAIHGDIQAAQSLISEHYEGMREISNNNNLTNAQRRKAAEELRDFTKEIHAELSQAAKDVKLNTQSKALTTLLNRDGRKLRTHLRRLQSAEKGIQTQLKALKSRSEEMVGNMKYLYTKEERAKWKSEKGTTRRKPLERVEITTPAPLHGVTGTKTYRYRRAR